MGLLQQVAVKALQFSRSRAGPLSPFFDELKALVSQINLVDCHYDAAAALFPRTSLYEYMENAPCLYTSIYENEYLHMSIFGLRSHGSMPLHDHPNMHGFLKVMQGRIEILSYTKTQAVQLPHNVPLTKLFKQQLAKWQKKTVFPVIVRPEKIVGHTDGTVVLTPSEENLHMIRPVGGEDAVFFDLLTPPYFPNERDCHYYTILEPLPSAPLPTSLGGEKLAWVAAVPSPESYYCEEIDYYGEQINLDDLMYAPSSRP